MNWRESKWFKIILFLPALVFFTFWYLSYYWQHDLVWDELVSLTNFILTDLTTTVTIYPDVNNHIFFSLIYNLYCKLIQVGDIYQAMSETMALRLLSFGISLIAILYTYMIGRKFLSIEAGLFASVILVTTIPYLNFAVQLRGYSLSATFLIASLYHIWRFIESKQKTDLILTCLFTSALLYTIPSNIYFGLCLGIIYTILWIRNTRKEISKEIANRKKSKKTSTGLSRWIRNNSYFSILLALGTAALVAYLAYQPVLEAILNERHLQQMKGQSHYLYNVQEVLPKVYFHFLSFRFLLIIPLALGIHALVRKMRLDLLDEADKKAIVLITLALLPFALSFIRGDRPPQRTFTPLAPLFALVLGYFSSRLIPDRTSKFPKIALYSGLFIAYCIGTFFFCRQHINTYLRKAINDGEMVYNSFYNFYQSDDYGYRYLDPLIGAAQQTGYPIVMAKEIDRVAEGEYLHKNNLRYFSTVWARSAPDPAGQGYQLQVLLEVSQGPGKRPGYTRIAFPASISEEAGKLVPMYYFLSQNKIIDAENPAFYVLTFAPRWFELMMKQHLPKLKAVRLTEDVSYHNAYLVTKR